LVKKKQKNGTVIPMLGARLVFLGWRPGLAALWELRFCWVTWGRITIGTI